MSAPSEQPTSRWRHVLMHHTITLVLSVLLFGAGLWGYLEFSQRNFFYTGTSATNEWDTPSSPLHYQVEAQRVRIEHAAIMYHMIQRTWPTSLQNLIEEAYLPQGALTTSIPGVSFGMDDDGDQVRVVVIKEDEKPKQ